MYSRLEEHSTAGHFISRHANSPKVKKVTTFPGEKTCAVLCAHHVPCATLCAAHDIFRVGLGEFQLSLTHIQHAAKLDLLPTTDCSRCNEENKIYNKNVI